VLVASLIANVLIRSIIYSFPAIARRRNNYKNLSKPLLRHTRSDLRLSARTLRASISGKQSPFLLFFENPFRSGASRSFPRRRAVDCLRDKRRTMPARDRENGPRTRDARSLNDETWEDDFFARSFSTWITLCFLDKAKKGGGGAYRVATRSEQLKRFQTTLLFCSQRARKAPTVRGALWRNKRHFSLRSGAFDRILRIAAFCLLDVSRTVVCCEITCQMPDRFCPRLSSVCCLLRLLAERAMAALGSLLSSLTSQSQSRLQANCCD